MASTAYVQKTPDWHYLGDLTRAMAALDNEVAKATRRRMKTEVVDPLAKKVKAKGSSLSRLDAKAARSVKTRGGAKPAIIGGANTSKDRVVFYGSEFGAHSNKYVTYIGRVGNWRGVVKRRTNRAYRPHRGQEGYWFHPTIEEGLDEATEQMTEIVEDTIERELF